MNRNTFTACILQSRKVRTKKKYIFWENRHDKNGLTRKSTGCQVIKESKALVDLCLAIAKGKIATSTGIMSAKAVNWLKMVMSISLAGIQLKCLSEWANGVFVSVNNCVVFVCAWGVSCVQLKRVQRQLIKCIHGHVSKYANAIFSNGVQLSLSLTRPSIVCLTDVLVVIMFTQTKQCLIKQWAKALDISFIIKILRPKRWD